MPDQSTSVDELVQDASDSLFKPESLADIRCRLSFIEASECKCSCSKHENALHDLANDDVPVLLKVIEQLAAEVERLRTGMTQEHAIRLAWQHPPRQIVVTDEDDIRAIRRRGFAGADEVVDVSRWVTGWSSDA